MTPDIIPAGELAAMDDAAFKALFPAWSAARRVILAQAAQTEELESSHE